MIPVKLAGEPPDFDQKVRQKGLSTVDELVGRAPRIAHRGRRHRKIADREDDIPADAFPAYWRDCLDDMLDRYDRRCAYTTLYLEHGTGSPTVDHFIPKSKAWSLIYEWSNYRLCAARFNSKRGIVSVVDPFTIADGWFALELVGFQVILGPGAPSRKRTRIDATLPILNLPEFCKGREMYATEYEQTHIDLDYLSRRAPFVALELRCQGRLRPEDS